MSLPPQEVGKTSFRGLLLTTHEGGRMTASPFDKYAEKIVLQVGP